MRNTGIVDYYKLDLREDGVYLIIGKTEGELISRKEVLRIIEDCQISNIDFAALNEIFSDKSSRIEKKISSNKDVVAKDEDVIIELDRNKMKAFMKFTPAGFMGKEITKSKIISRINEFGVSYGIDEKIIEELSRHRKYNERYEFARGLKSVDGKNGYLEYKVELEKKSGKPTIQDDGTVDFHALDLFESVTPGQMLVIAHKPENGRDGKNVLGEAVPYRPGKPAPLLPKGKNTDVRGENEILYATTSGMVVFNGKKIDVSSLLEIPGDVGPATGDISFNGSVTVKGSVLTGFSVFADDIIEVVGIVEGAYLKSGSDINLQSGVQGGEKATIIADGDIKAKFAEGATMKSRGNICAGSIMHSNVDCSGDLIIDGRLSVLIGGKVRVGNKVFARRLGSVMATKTDIIVGNNPEDVAEFEKLKEEMIVAKRRYKDIQRICDVLTQESKVKGLTKDKEALLIRASQTRSTVLARMNEIKQIIEENLLPKLGGNKGIIAVSDKIFSGVNVTIGNAMLSIKDDIGRCTLSNVGGKIVVQDYYE